MAGLLRRFSLLLKVWLKAIMAPAEDPRQSSTYERQRELLAKVQKALIDIAETKSRLETKTVEVRKKLPRLKKRALAALTDGREDLARLVLQRRQIAVVELQTLEEQVQEIEQEEQRLSLTEQRLATQIEAFYARLEVIMARYSAAEAQVRINEALSGVSEELADLGRALEVAEQKTDHMQARASAIDRLVEEGILEVPTAHTSSDVERQLAQIDVAQDVEEQLAALKRQLEK
ncbi:MAG: PspA/IM30 family protein [Candidatus Marinimicrobia bacterium]|nr:PspA/IM30 family protein [Candidatus Neomarinimicrobiota bacterium]